MATQTTTATTFIHRTKPAAGGHYLSLEVDNHNGGSAIHTDAKLDHVKLKIDSSPPLCRTKAVSSPTIMLYRLLMLMRFVALIIFLRWRIRNVNPESAWLGWFCITSELWFCISWILDQLPKLRPVYRSADVDALREQYNFNTVSRSSGGAAVPRKACELPGIDVFVTTADHEKEPTLTTANTILSILAADYPADKLSVYLSDDGGALVTLEAAAEAAKFAKVWVPFCRKHRVEPRKPEMYFDAVKKEEDDSDEDEHKALAADMEAQERRRVKKEYEEFKAQVNALPEVIRRRSKILDAEKGEGVVSATWMADGARWPGTWIEPSAEHARGDHAGIVRVLINAASHYTADGTRLPMLVYISREKRPGHDHQKKAGAMNALVRASAVLSNNPYILNLDCDHYVNNSAAFLAGICFMLDRAHGGDNVAFIQFPQRFDGVDPTDMWANHNRMFFDSTMRALDGLQGPIYIGTGSLFRRAAIYGFDPPPRQHKTSAILPLHVVGGAPPPSALDCGKSENALSAVISCTYEDNTDWGRDIGWVYGTVTEDVVTGYRMHTRGWRSMYFVMKPDAFRGTAPINLTDRLYQCLRWATGSLEIFFSRNNPLLGGRKLHFLQRIAYLNITTYPFSSVFLLVYCFLPVLTLVAKHLIPQPLTVMFTVHLGLVMVLLLLLAVVEMKWSGVTLPEWWRNEQFWMLAATSAYLTAVVQVTLKLVAGVEISFKLTAKQAATGDDAASDPYAELYLVKWTALMIVPLAVTVVNVGVLAIGVGKVMYGESPLLSWAALAGVVFNLWVLVHLYPFVQGLMGRQGEKKVVLVFWLVIVVTTLALIYVAMRTSIAYNPRVLSAGRS